MKKILFFPLMLMLMAATCHKTSKNDELYIRGKVSHRSCATIVVQVLDPSHYHLTTERWQQSADKPVFEHVFSVANPCSFPADYKPGDAFYFAVIKDDPANKDCVVCMLYDNPPAEKHLIKVIISDRN